MREVNNAFIDNRIAMIHARSEYKSTLRKKKFVYNVMH